MTNPHSVDQLRAKIRDIGGDVGDGTVGGYVDLDTTINLNQFALNAGPTAVTYKPDQFSGLVYDVDQEGAKGTGVVFKTGVVAVVDAPDEATGNRTLMAVCRLIDELELVGDVTVVPREDATFGDTIPVPA